MKYDFFCSPGGSCASAHQLKECKLRLASLPFDWLFCIDNRTIANLTECFRCDFSNWMLRENLKELTAEERGISSIFQCRDSATGYRFIHDFHADPATGNEYDGVKLRYARRIERLYDFLKNSQRIAFLFDAAFPVDVAQFQALRMLLLEKFGRKKALDFHIVELNSAHPGIEKSEGLTVYRHAHAKHDYLYKNKSFEFDFLDDMELSGKIAQPAGRNVFLEINRLPHGIRLIFFRRLKSYMQFRLRLFGRPLELHFGNPWE